MYFRAFYRGSDAAHYGHRQEIVILIESRLFGRFKVTPCHGYELKPMVDMTLHYRSLTELVVEWELVAPTSVEEVYLGKNN